MNTVCDALQSASTADPFRLAMGRVHEAEGPGRRSFALFQSLRHPGPVLWILEEHEPHRLFPAGLPADLPERLHLLIPKGETDLLWSVEEGLRSSAVTFVVAEPQAPLSLTAGRRLQLAAEAGRTTGLLLTREGQGSNATETRWRCAPVAAAVADSTLHEWSLKKNKKGTIGFWTVNWNGTTTDVHLVSEAGERHKPAKPPG